MFSKQTKLDLKKNQQKNVKILASLQKDKFKFN